MNNSIVVTTGIPRSSVNFKLIAPISMTFALVAMILASFILIWIILKKQLHSVTNMLVCNTCVSSILYCTVQCNNYIYLLFITWDTSNMSCRWRGYFAYMSIVAVVYSYLLQAISRLFISVLSTKYRWLVSLKTHVVLILVEWIIVLLAPLPALVTQDIYFREGFLCWVPTRSMLHVGYTVLIYYFIPTVLVVIIYITIYVQIKRGQNNAFIQQTTTRRRQNRDLKILRNIAILFTIYSLGGIPWALYTLTRIEIFFSISMVSITLAIAVEKAVLILLNQELRNTIIERCSHSAS